VIHVEIVCKWHVEKIRLFVAKIAKNGLFRHNREIFRMKIEERAQSFFLLRYFTTYVWVWIFSEIVQKQNTIFKKNLLLPVKLIYRLVLNAILKIYSKICSQDYELLFQRFIWYYYVAIKSYEPRKKSGWPIEPP
jgi:hypothetical protein